MAPLTKSFVNISFSIVKAAQIQLGRVYKAVFCNAKASTTSHRTGEIICVYITRHNNRNAICPPSEKLFQENAHGDIQFFSIMRN